MWRACALACLLVALSAVAHAQVVNPTTVEFTVSADHNAVQFGAPVVARYELRVYAPGAAAPITTRYSLRRFHGVAIGPGGEGASGPVPFAAQARVPAAATGLSLR